MNLWSSERVHSASLGEDPHGTDHTGLEPVNYHTTVLNDQDRLE